MKSKNRIIIRLLAFLLALGGLALLIINIPPVVLTWETASEVGTAGFNVYRQTADGDEELVQVNDSLIESRGDELTGAAYRFEDENVRAGQRYLYRIEEVEWGGSATLFPNTVAVRAGLPASWVKIEGGILLLLAVFLLWRSFRKQ